MLWQFKNPHAEDDELGRQFKSLRVLTLVVMGAAAFFTLLAGLVAVSALVVNAARQADGLNPREYGGLYFSVTALAVTSIIGATNLYGQLLTVRRATR
jgi:hypothetical protein